MTDVVAAVILGLPKAHADRIKGQLKSAESAWREGWSISFQPPTGANNQIRQADVRAAIGTAQEHGSRSHILAITNQGGDTKTTVAGQFIPYFRFRWLPGNWLALPYPAPADFIENVNSILLDEEDWRVKVQPKDSAAPLLLPESAFTTKLSDLWSLATKFGEGNSIACARRIEQFSQQHLKPHSTGHFARKTLWTDNDLRVFDHTLAQHGTAPLDRRWKYSFRIPDGFHYDVRHAQGKKFIATGVVRNESVVADGYVNLDPHGHFRDN